VSIPVGTLSAFNSLLFVSVPVGTQFPVPSHGVCAFAELLCNALFTVNSPIELPVRSASYTVPDSNAIGIGSAL
jgi:hypothetical protein